MPSVKMIRGQPCSASFIFLFISTLSLISGPALCTDEPGTSLNVLLLPANIASSLMTLGSLGEGLVSRGHRVTMVYPSTLKVPAPVMSMPIERDTFYMPYPPFMHRKEATEEIISIALSGSTNEFYVHMAHEWEEFDKECEFLFKDEALFKRLKEKAFDIAVIEDLPCSSIMPYSLSVPYVFLGTFLTTILRNPEMPSVVPRTWHPTGMTDHMSFFERLQNAGLFIMDELAVQAIDDGGAFCQKYVPHKPPISVLEQTKKAELFFYTMPPVLDFPRPLMPNMVYLNAMGRPAKALTGHWTQVVEEADHGIVVASFGTIVGYLPEDVVDTFLKAFGMVEQKVIWRFKGHEKPAAASPNTHLADWIPQNDLLGHRNTRLFVSHGGTSGLLEAIYHGVPVVCVPFFVDQINNCAVVKSRGYGEHLPVHTLTSEGLSEAMKRVLNDPSYKSNTSVASAILKNPQNSAEDVADYWLRYVVQYGTKHLRSAAIEMPLYQYYLIDVFAFVMAAVAVVLVLMCLVVAACCYCLKRAVQKLKTE